MAKFFQNGYVWYKIKLTFLSFLLIFCLCSLGDGFERGGYGEVYYVRNADAVGFGGKIRGEVVRRMVENLICGVTGQRSPEASWGKILSELREGEVVGIKVSAQGGRMGGTRVEVVEAIVKGLGAVGLNRERIVVWDRRREDLLACGFREEHPDYVLAWTEGEGGSGYDAERVVTAPLLGKLTWGDRGFLDLRDAPLERMVTSAEQMSSRSSWSRILVRKVQKVIHVPSLQDHFGVGVNGAVAGMTIGNLDNWRRLVGPPAHGNPYLAEIFAEPEVRGRVVLTILDGLYLQYAGGPFASPAESKEYGVLLASQDVVALDSVARELLEGERVARGLPKLEKQTVWLKSAQELGLGRAEGVSLREVGGEVLKKGQ